MSKNMGHAQSVLRSRSTRDSCSGASVAVFARSDYGQLAEITVVVLNVSGTFASVVRTVVGINRRVVCFGEKVDFYGVEIAGRIAL